MCAVTKAVILAAGLGTRLLPATKAIPKMMLPIVDKPTIQYAVEEAIASGITDITFVLAEDQQSLVSHFGYGSRAERIARETGNEALLALVLAPAELATFHFVQQGQPLGIAHAVACAREYLEGAPFLLMFPDDVIFGDVPVARQIINAHSRSGGSVVAVEAVPLDEVSNYGVVDPSGDGDPMPIKGIVEKPSAAHAPSSLAVVGRYLLSETIFKHIAAIQPSARGELEITDALASQITAGEPVAAATFAGERFDTGRPAGYLLANVAAALRRSDLGDSFRRQLRNLVNRELDGELSGELV